MMNQKSSVSVHVCYDSLMDSNVESIKFADCAMI